MTHFPIALWSMSLPWDVIALWRGETLWWQIGFWSLAAGWVFALPAMLAGLWDSTALAKDPKVEKALQAHINAISVAACAYGAELLVHGTTYPPEGWMRPLTLSLSLLGLLSLSYGGWLGAELVYRFGAGRGDE